VKTAGGVIRGVECCVVAATFKKFIPVVCGLLAIAAAVRIGSAAASRPAACRAGADPTPPGAPPPPSAPTDRRGVWVVNVDGSGERQIPTGQPGGWPSVAAFAWSRDGMKIAYTDTNAGLMVTTVDGTGFVDLGVAAANPAWSVDGAKLAFVSNGIDVMNSDGSGRLTIVPPNPNQPRDPAWSPDGRQLAYWGWSGRDAIQVTNSDGSSQQTVAAERDFRLSGPNWSPDGRRIAFAATGGYYGTWLGIVRADGTGLRRIASHCGGANPAWSPDGTRIAYADRYGIVVVDADGGDRYRVPNSWYGHQPTWSADGKRIAFVRI
jgi:Tol biopolymer transport system component